jgi:hypothetical protein
VEAGHAKIDRLRAIARKHGLSLLQLACLWNLSQPPVQSVVPTLIQEMDANAKPIEAKVDELASLPPLRLTPEECAFIRQVGDNRGCMDLKGANPAHTGPDLADRWSLSPALEAVALRWGIDPTLDLACRQHPPA